MRALLITQDDPFYLPDTIRLLLEQVEDKHDMVGCILLSASPFGKNTNFFKKIVTTYKVFGPKFFLKYATLFIANKLVPGKSIRSLLAKHNIPIITLADSINANSSLHKIKKLQADIFISISANEIFRQPLLEIPPKGCINLHTSKLPSYRGLMPTFWAMKNQEQEIGVSVFLVDEGIDSGPIIKQKTVNIGDKSQAQLIQETKSVGVSLILDALDEIENGNTVLQENDDQNSSYYGFPTREDVIEFLRIGARFF